MLRSIGKPNAGVAAGRENGLWTASLASLNVIAETPSFSLVTKICWLFVILGVW
jgi:hypothetical protein